MRFSVLGPLEVLDRDGVAVVVRGSKVRTVLAMLVMRAGEPVTTGQLCDAVWGDDPPATAANALQAHMSKLRRLLEPGMLENRDGSYSLALTGSTVDASDFTELATAGHEHLIKGNTKLAVTTLRHALALWRGEPLSDIDEAEFAIADRVRLHEARLTAHEDLLEAELAEGASDAVVAAAEALLVANPLRERTWATLMTALYRSDRQADALRAFQRARLVLAEELGLDPGPALRTLESRILAHDPALQPVAADGAATNQLTNMHPSLSNFVGRAEEVSALATAIHERRLVTLTGPGGVGKTRLATEVALASAESWPDGTWFVDLGIESGAGAADRAFRRTFSPRLGHSDGSTLPWLAAGLSTSRLLVVLDNCEHVLADVAALVDSLLRACGHVHVLATSREPLGCAGELVRKIAPLSIDEAIELFKSRAADSSIAVDDDEETELAVQAICAQVDRLPLAIELTAARARVFSVAQMAEMLHRRSSLVSTDSSARPQRQQTLESAVGWSYELLFEGEQKLLSRLSVFAGGFTLDAATAVCSDRALPADDIGLMLARLVDKSLVTTLNAAAAPRFHLLRPVFEFAESRLAEAGETHAFRTRHVEWLIELTTPVKHGMRGPDALMWGALVNAEMANLTRAGQWLVENGNAAHGLTIACNIGWYAFLSANVYDDHHGLRAMLDRAGDCEPALVCRAMSLVGLLSIGHTDGRSWAIDVIDVARSAAAATSAEPSRAQQQSIDTTQAAIEMARQIGDPALLTEVLGLGALHIAVVGLAPDTVSSLAAELRETAAGVGDRWHVALAAGLDGLAAYVQDDLVDAIASYESCIAEMQALGDAGTASLFQISASEAIEFLGQLDDAIEYMLAAYQHSTAAQFRSSSIVRSCLCWLTARNGEVERSLALGREGLAAVRRPFNPVVRAHVLFGLGTAELLAGLSEPAAEHVSEALAIHERLGMTRETAMDHRALGEIAALAGDGDRASMHGRRAVALALEVGLPWTVMLTVRALAESYRDDVQTACTLIGVAEAIGDQHGYRHTPDERRRHDQLLTDCTQRVGAPVVEAALRRGATLGIAEIAELASVSNPPTIASARG